MSESNDPGAAESLSETDEAYCAACNQSFTIDAAFCPNDGAKLIKLKARPDTLIGRVFDHRYEVRAPLGHGGMGTVYRGWQLSVDREIAIKVIHPKLASDRNVAKRFLREARLASRLNQSNIVTVYEFGQTDDGILYLIMELLRGRPLSKDLEAQRPLPMKRIKTIALQMCDALGIAHGQGIIHRDLKPGNIVILDEPPGRDVIKVLDFGLAKSLQEDTSLVTKTDAILGTPLYMPPEQILGKPSDQTADLYSFGCILYQLATGRPPYIGDNVNLVLASHVRDPLPVLGENVPEDLQRLIEKLMQKEPVDRYQAAHQVRDALEALGDDPDGKLIARPVGAPPPQGVRSDVIRSEVPDSLLDPAAALAVTTATPPPVVMPSTHPSLDRPPMSRRWLLPAIALVLAGGVATAVFLTMRTDDTSARGQVGPVDSAQVTPDVTVPLVAADAGVEADTRAATSPPDAAKAAVDAGRAPVDAPRRAPPDARPRVPDARVAQPPRDAGARTIPPDAAVDVVRPRDAGPALKPDARPDIDLLPTGRKSTP